jgi:hypothetical protein
MKVLGTQSHGRLHARALTRIFLRASAYQRVLQLRMSTLVTQLVSQGDWYVIILYNLL